MKIMHVELGRYLYGGAKQVFYLLNGLSRYPIQNCLTCADKSEISKVFGDESRLKIYPMPFAGDHDLFFIFKLIRIIRCEKPDLVHIHSRRGDMLAILAAWLTKTPIIYSRRVDNPPNWFELHFKFPLVKKFITISHGIKLVMQNFGIPAEKIDCVCSAVDTDQFKPKAGREAFFIEQSIRPDTIVMGVIAQLIPRKGHRFLLDALPSVLARHPNVHVLFFGQGPLEAELKESIIQRGLSPSVSLIGFRRDMDAILPGLDLVVHPALMEGLGVSLLEAASSGIPIVACSVGGIPEIVKDQLNGLLVSPGNAAGLAQAINSLLDDPVKLKEFGRAGRELVLNEFSIQNMVKGNHDVYLTTSCLSD